MLASTATRRPAAAAGEPRCRGPSCGHGEVPECPFLRVLDERDIPELLGPELAATESAFGAQGH